MAAVTLELEFQPREHDTWRALYDAQEECRRSRAHPVFVRGLAELRIGRDGVPSLRDVNRRLLARTGWRGVPVSGLEGPVSFFAGLARREFPIGSFIRNVEDSSYTPAPDVFHDLYGHLPFLADPHYADFCVRFGTAALAFAGFPEAIRQFERVFWFGVEFPLIKTPVGRRIFGGGILSSHAESIYCLSDQPEVRPFDLDDIRRREFRIDIVQPLLYELDRPEDLYRCVEPLIARIRREN
jgi:phenylalanine-4-hydroxylase